jgi:2-polyprenyl-6-hydroxyphenyl methylase/3-demethylubiquinone-9 3-methyltransferase
MNEVAVTTGVPDYGWDSAQAEQSHDYLQPAVLRALQSVAARQPDRLSPLRVFDAGCGNGALLHRLQSCGMEVAGCDASESGIGYARAMCGEGVQIAHMSVYDDLAGTFGATWDAVVATEVIEHLYSPRDFIRQAERLLLPGGALVLTTPYHGYLKNLTLAATGKLDAHFTALWDGGHIKFWSYKTLGLLLREFGFTQLAFYGAGRLPWLWKSMVIVAGKPQ